MTYDAQWREYRRRRNLFWLIWLTYIPGVLVIGLPLESLIKSEVPIYFVAFGWLIAFAVAGWRLSYWRCPHCGKWFLPNGGSAINSRESVFTVACESGQPIRLERS